MRILLSFALVTVATCAIAHPLVLTTEEYPPFSYRENGGFKGSSIEQVERIMADAGLEYRIEMKPWSRALAEAENHLWTCVFTTVHNEQRHARFKWIEPILTSRTLLVRKSGANVDAATLEDARRFVVGTQRNDFTADMLTRLQFRKIDLTSDFNVTLNKLQQGRIDLMPISESYFFRLRAEGAKLESVLVLADPVYSIACNPHIPDDIIERMRQSLARLIADGTQKAILRKYKLDLAGP